MKKETKAIRIEIKYPLMGSHQIYPLLSADVNLQLHGIVGLKDVKFKEIIVVYEIKTKKFKGF